jgi:hypothetical protein
LSDLAKVDRGGASLISGIGAVIAEELSSLEDAGVTELKGFDLTREAWVTRETFPQLKEEGHVALWPTLKMSARGGGGGEVGS